MQLTFIQRIFPIAAILGLYGLELWLAYKAIQAILIGMSLLSPQWWGMVYLMVGLCLVFLVQALRIVNVAFPDSKALLDAYFYLSSKGIRPFQPVVIGYFMVAWPMVLFRAIRQIYDGKDHMRIPSTWIP